MKTIRSVILPFVLACTALGFFSACSPTKARYPETVAQLVFLRMANENAPFYWLDKDRLFVVGYAKADFPTQKKHIFILDTRNNTYERYAEFPVEYSAWFCFSNGFISYPVLDENGVVQWKEGAFGQEQIVPTETHKNTAGQLREYGDCAYIDRSRRLRPEHVELESKKLSVAATFLQAAHGYLYSGYCDDPPCRPSEGLDFDARAKLYRPNVDEPIELPIRNKELSFRSFVRYVPWANKYVIVAAMRRDAPNIVSNRLAGTAPWQVYLLSPNGHTESISLKEAGWLPPGNAGLTRVGLYLVGNNGSRTDEGGWLVKPSGEREHLFKGIVMGSGVSPDGCKLAYAAAGGKDNLVHVLDLCAGN